MMSILIPVFNRDVNLLVQQLSSQIRLLHHPAEIIIVDDGSNVFYKELNRKLGDTAFVEYVESASNNGRIRTRQRLASMAVYEWLLFLDCDNAITSDHFLKTYCDHLTGFKQVVVGGRRYASKRPSDCSFMLHWKYGAKREVTRFDKRGHTNRFMTNNFLIPRAVFTEFDFDNGWSGYGYEDTWMGTQLEAMKVPVVFIDNPVLHEGVESASIFIAKSEEALQNLKRLSSLISPGALTKHVKLYSYYRRLASWKMLWVVRMIYAVMQESIKKNLLSCNPSLLQFDLYRLNYFVNIVNL